MFRKPYRGTGACAGGCAGALTTWVAQIQIECCFIGMFTSPLEQIWALTGKYIEHIKRMKTLKETFHHGIGGFEASLGTGGIGLGGCEATGGLGLGADAIAGIAGPGTDGIEGGAIRARGGSARTACKPGSSMLHPKNHETFKNRGAPKLCLSSAH